MRKTSVRVALVIFGLVALSSCGSDSGSGQDDQFSQFTGDKFKIESNCKVTAERRSKVDSHTYTVTNTVVSVDHITENADGSSEIYTSEVSGYDDSGKVLYGPDQSSGRTDYRKINESDSETTNQDTTVEHYRDGTTQTVNTRTVSVWRRTSSTSSELISLTINGVDAGYKVYKTFSKIDANSMQIEKTYTPAGHWSTAEYEVLSRRHSCVQKFIL